VDKKDAFAQKMCGKAAFIDVLSSNCF